MKKLGISTFIICVFLWGFSALLLAHFVYDVIRRPGEYIAGNADDVLQKAELDYEDRVIKRRDFSKIDILWTWLATGEIDSAQVIQGKEGWFFYRSSTDETEGTIGDYQGLNCYTREEMEQIAADCRFVQDQMDAKGITFTTFFGPNKSSIYPEYMPDIYQHAQQSRMDLLFSYLNEQGISAVNPKEALLSAKNEQELYYYYDTHWNERGGYVATREALGEWGIDVPELDELTVYRSDLADDYHFCATDDLTNMVGLRRFFTDDNYYHVEETPEIDWDQISSEQDREIISHLHNDAALTDQKVFLVGDSFRAAMLPLLSMTFCDVYAVNMTIMEPEMLDELEPDYVIFEMCEREAAHLDSVKELFLGVK